MNPSLVRATVVAIVLPHALAGTAAPYSLGVSGGPVVAAGEGASDLPNGLGFQLDLMLRRHASNEWIARLEYGDFGSTEGPGFVFSGGRIAPSPQAITRLPLRSTILEAGLSHRLGTLVTVRPRLEGLVGVSWNEQPGRDFTFQNSRRPDPALYLVPSVDGRWVPAVSLGFAFEATTVGRLDWNVAAAARWLPTAGFNGVLLPVRAGLSWPASNAAITPRDPSRASPVLRISSGLSILRKPTRLRGEMRAASTFSAALEVPVSRGFAWSLQGEQAAQRATGPSVAGVMVDSLGHRTILLADPGTRLSMTVTAATFGLRLSRAFGRVTAAARGGVGWGRTGGFGTTVRSSGGAYIGPNGAWIPVETAVDVGAGEPTTGFAWSGSLGAEIPVRGAIAVFAEAGALSVRLTRDDVLDIPVRLGLALR